MTREIERNEPKLCDWLGTPQCKHGATDGLHTAENKDAKRYSVVRGHSVGERCSVMCLEN